MKTPRLIINGAKGRMGQALVAAAAELSLPVAAALDAGDDLAAALPGADVVVDFSAHSATARVIELAVAQGKALVIGTTGHPAAEKLRLTALAARVPTVWAGNFSIGVNLLFALTARAARVLGDDYDAELVEMHHRHKKDAPSGTAARLLELILEARHLGPGALRHGRSGITGERTRQEIGVHALRGGGVIGDHTVIFASPGERLELTHKAGDRAIFAHGALRAAQWVVQQPPGVYDMQDVLGLKDLTMITRITGTLLAATPLTAVIETGGLAYEVHIPVTTAERLPQPGQQARLHTLVVYREDAQTLYGFSTEEERDFFRLLVEKVTGVGPKMALSVLSKLSLPVLKGAITAGDVGLLAKCPGIGKKTAERLVMELRDKLGGSVAEALPAAGSAQDAAPAENKVRDAVMALVALGYKAADADKSVRQAWVALGATASTEALIKKALG